MPVGFERTGLAMLLQTYRIPNFEAYFITPEIRSGRVKNPRWMKVPSRVTPESMMLADGHERGPIHMLIWQRMCQWAMRDFERGGRFVLQNGDPMSADEIAVVTQCGRWSEHITEALERLERLGWITREDVESASADGPPGLNERHQFVRIRSASGEKGDSSGGSGHSSGENAISSGLNQDSHSHSHSHSHSSGGGCKGEPPDLAILDGPVVSSERHAAASVVERAWANVPKPRRRSKGAFRDAVCVALRRDPEIGETIVRRIGEFYASPLGRSQYARFPPKWVADEAWDEPDEAWQIDAASSGDGLTPVQRLVAERARGQETKS